MKIKNFIQKPLVIISAVVIILLIAAILVFIGSNQPKVDYGKELLRNGGFEILDQEGIPEGWQADAYLNHADITFYHSVDGKDGLGALISNTSMNDARFAQTIPVSPNTIYRFSGEIKAKAEGGRGANLSIADVYVFSEAVYETDGQWQHVEIYGVTGKKQRTLTVFARLGGYSGEAVGEASFDNLSLMAVERIPGDQVLQSWEKPSSQPQGNQTLSSEKKSQAPWLLLAALVFAWLLYKLAQWAISLEEKHSLVDNKSFPSIIVLIGLLMFALLSRLWLATAVQGFPVDINAFRVWADNMAEVGPKGFYLLEGHRDYPPGYMLVLWPLGMLGRLLGTGVTELMVKLPSIICDIFIIFLLFIEGKKYVGERSALALSCLYALNPLTYLAGAAWGQVDSVPSLLLLITLLFILRKRWRYALPVYVLAVLMKPQSLMVGPLGLLAFVMQFFWEKDSTMRKNALIDALIGFGGAVGAMLIIALPFFNQTNGFSWLFGLYGNTMSYYHYASVNATNLFFLFGLNWVDIQQTTPIMVRLAGAVTLMAPVAAFVLKTVHQDRYALHSPDKSTLPWYLAVLACLPAFSALLPFSLSMTGTLFMVSVFLLVGLMYVQGRQVNNLPLLAGILLLGFSVLGTMMHERYLFLAVVMLILAYVIRRDRRILGLLIAVSVLCFLNTGLALDRGVRIGGSAGNLHAPAAGLISDSAWLEYLLSGFSLLLTGFAIYFGFDLLNFPQKAMVKPLNFRNHETSTVDGLSDILAKKDRVRFDFKDAIIILLVTVLYAVVSLVNLGSTTSPQNPWVSSPEQTEATLDLGSQQSFKLLFFGGIHWSETNFQVEISADGETFESYPFNMTEGGLFAWRTLGFPFENANGKTDYDRNPRILNGRYVRISGIDGKLTLMEIIAQDANTGENLPFASASLGAESLIDEQTSFSGRPSWHNSMYFDEIYHARSAYEQRNGLLGETPSQVYETSHPPLGKVLMTFSVMIFGMTPFGWRFAGAMAGVMMLPGMYLLGKLFTKRRTLGLLAMLLMAFDFMHFAQTRIATIDSFVTLFIIYAYYFMFRYMMMDHIRESFKKRMIPLSLSALMMGLAIASKWPGIYAGLGLAVLFFYTQAMNIKAGLALDNALKRNHRFNEEDDILAKGYARRYFKEFLYTCLWCFLFFIVVPLVIYYLSYLPVYIASPGGLTIQKVVNNNLSMFAYHSQPNFGADHPYSSPWYSWPIIGKPIYFYSGGRIDNTSSVIWSFGNPLVWWLGLLSLILVMGWYVFQRFYAQPISLEGQPKSFSARLAEDTRPALLLVAFLAQYLPWVLVPRGTYIYHYFPSVPFIILCIAVILDAVCTRFPRIGRTLWIGMAVLAGILFIVYFPYFSGIRVSTTWLELKRFLPIPLYY